MDLGTIATMIARGIDVLNAAIWLAPWLRWLQVLAVAAAAGTFGWLARGLRLRRPHSLQLSPSELTGGSEP
jgi:hypothetical protein